MHISRNKTWKRIAHGLVNYLVLPLKYNTIIEKMKKVQGPENDNFNFCFLLIV